MIFDVVLRLEIGNAPLKSYPLINGSRKQVRGSRFCNVVLLNTQYSRLQIKYHECDKFIVIAVASNVIAECCITKNTIVVAELYKANSLASYNRRQKQLQNEYSFILLQRISLTFMHYDPIINKDVLANR